MSEESKIDMSELVNALNEKFGADTLIERGAGKQVISHEELTKALWDERLRNLVEELDNDLRRANAKES